MDSNSERRIYRRFVCETDISHDLLAHSHIYKGKLQNFSKGGLYFESDQSIFPGEEVFIKFQNQHLVVGYKQGTHLQVISLSQDLGLC